MKKERLTWIDNMRGVAVVLMLLGHAHYANKFELALLTMYVIPTFFLISGYLTKYDGSDPLGFFYNRVLKLVFVYVAYAFLLPYLSVSEFINVVHNPSLIVEKVLKSVRDLVWGKPMWFVACLIIVNIIFMLIRKISQSNKVLFIISLSVASVGVGVSYILGEGVRPWNADTALVSQLFFTIGYILREIERPEWYENAKMKAIITGSMYVAVVAISGYFLDYSEVAINPATNNWGKLWLTIPLVSLCLYAGLCSSRLFIKLKLFPFFGQTSLIYFAIGNHGMSVMDKLFGIMYNKTGLPILANRAIINPLIALLGAIILMPVVWVVNRYAPFFNGRYKMPKIKNDIYLK